MNLYLLFLMVLLACVPEVALGLRRHNTRLPPVVRTHVAARAVAAPQVAARAVAAPEVAAPEIAVRVKSIQTRQNTIKGRGVVLGSVKTIH
jgi:hypothetical protein